jgi:DNA-binding NtrC family response regulator
VAAGRFRDDLYYRLKVVTLRVPPLRERREDIPLLVRAFVADFNRRNRRDVEGLSAGALARVVAHDWPGNVRELKNAIEGAAVLAGGDVIDVGDLERARASALESRRVDASPDGSLSIPANATLREAEHVLIKAHLARAKTKADAARSLGIGLRTLYTKLHEMEP